MSEERSLEELLADIDEAVNAVLEPDSDGASPYLH